MALKIALSDIKGQTMEYHKIISIGVVFIEGKQNLQVALGGYTNEQYRALEKEDGTERVVANCAFNLPIVDDEFSRTNLYARIKSEIPEFEGAEDV